MTGTQEQPDPREGEAPANAAAEHVDEATLAADAKTEDAAAEVEASAAETVENAETARDDSNASEAPQDNGDESGDHKDDSAVTEDTDDGVAEAPEAPDAPTADRIDALYRSRVVDSQGAKIGSVAQVYLDDDSGEPSWLTVNTGFLGLREVFVPLAEAQQSDDVVTVPFTREQVKAAPRVDPDGHIEASDEQQLRSYYASGPAESED